MRDTRTNIVDAVLEVVGVDKRKLTWSQVAKLNRIVRGEFDTKAEVTFKEKVKCILTAIGRWFK
jgi:hypothetical protein